MILKSSLCDYIIVYILVKEAILAPNRASTGQSANNNSTGVVFKICAPCTGYINQINNLQIHNAKGNYAVILMYNVIEYSDNYSKTSGHLWQNYRD